MKLRKEEVEFLTALARELNQTGCRGPAHDLLREHAYPVAPREGSGSLAFAYETVPLTGLLLQECKDLHEIDDFLREEPLIPDPEWPWKRADEYRDRLSAAKRIASQGNTLVTAGRGAASLIK